MSVFPIKVVCLVLKWVATLFAVAATVVAVLFLYDLVARGKWGYPWWVLPIVIVTAIVSWLLRREATSALQQISKQDTT